MAKFSLAQENLVRQVFPVTIDMEITSIGSTGFNVTEFSALYPEKLNIFVPFEFVTNRISNAIPAEFENFFRPLDDFLDYVSRMTETKVGSALRAREVQYVVGQLSHFSTDREYLTTFTLRPNGPSSSGTVLFCRCPINTNGDLSVLTNAVSRIVAECKPEYIDTALCDGQYDDQYYVYWGMKPRQVFSDVDFFVTSLMATTPVSKRPTPTLGYVPVITQRCFRPTPKSS